MSYHRSIYRRLLVLFISLSLVGSPVLATPPLTNQPFTIFGFPIKNIYDAATTHLLQSAITVPITALVIGCTNKFSDKFQEIFSNKQIVTHSTPTVSFDDIQGPLPEKLQELKAQIQNKGTYNKLGVGLPNGVLLHGEPGTGKTVIAQAFAHELGAEFFEIKSTDIIDKYVGESAKNAQKILDAAHAAAARSKNKTAIIFMDEIDGIGSKRSEQKSDAGSNVQDEINRMVNVFLQGSNRQDSPTHILLIGTTNRPQVLDSALTRPGRLDYLVEVKAPTEDTRKKILEHTIKKYSHVTDYFVVKPAEKKVAPAGFFGRIYNSLVTGSFLPEVKGISVWDNPSCAVADAEPLDDSILSPQQTPIDINKLASATAGATGADLEYMVKNAARTAATGHKIAIDHDDLINNIPDKCRQITHKIAREHAFIRNHHNKVCNEIRLLAQQKEQREIRQRDRALSDYQKVIKDISQLKPVLKPIKNITDSESATSTSSTHNSLVPTETSSPTVLLQSHALLHSGLSRAERRLGMHKRSNSEPLSGQILAL